MNVQATNKATAGTAYLRLLLGRALEAYRRLTHAALLHVTHAHDARVHRARNAVVVLAVELREHVDCGTARRDGRSVVQSPWNQVAGDRNSRSKAEAALRSFKPPASTMLRTMKRPMALSCRAARTRLTSPRTQAALFNHDLPLRACTCSASNLPGGHGRGRGGCDLRSCASWAF